MKIEAETKELMIESERKRKALQDENQQLIIEAERRRNEITKKQNEWENNIKLEQQKVAEQRRNELQKQSNEWENTIKLKHQQTLDEMRKQQEAEMKRLQEELAKTKQAQTSSIVDDHDPQYGIRNRKVSSPITKLKPTVAKSNSGARALQKVTKMPSAEKKKPPSVITNITSSSRAKPHMITNPTPDEDGLFHLWNGHGDKEPTSAFQNAAYNGLKHLSDTASHFIPDFLTTTDSHKKGKNDSFEEVMVIGDDDASWLSAADEKEFDKEFDTVPLH